jgi:Ca-activated chloride channel family protein
MQCQTADQESPPSMILILDGSGSMLGSIDNKTKIGISKEVISSFLEKTNPNQPVGLEVYGHRRKGDCNDIETLISPAVDNHQEILTALDNIKPIGKTPLANTLFKVINHLKKENDSATLILISDGIESCGGDLCKVVKEAKEAGVEFVLHIVGFDLGDSDKLALECAAKEGDGMYFDAENGEQLSEALEKTKESTIGNRAPTLSVRLTKDGNKHDAVIKVFKSGENNYFMSRRTYTGVKTNPALFGILPGIYDIQASPVGTDAETLTRKNVVIKAGELREIEIDFTAGKLSILTTGNGEPWDCVVNIYKEGETKTAAKGRTYNSSSSNPMIKELTTGLYNIKMSPMSIIGGDTNYEFKNVEVVAGTISKVEYNYEYGEIAVGAKNNGAPWDCVLNVNEGADGKKYLAGGRTGKSQDSKPKKYLLSPGTYNVLFKPDGIYGLNPNFTVENINVEPKSKTEVVHDYQSGILQITVKHKNEYWNAIVSIYQNGVEVYNKRSGTSDPKNIYLIPGKYDVKVVPVKLDATPRKFEIDIKKGMINKKFFGF